MELRKTATLLVPHTSFCTFLSVTTAFSLLSLNLDMVLQLHKNSLAFDKVSQLE